MKTPKLWIPRKLSDRIYKQIISDEPKVNVWMIEADAGLGKTILARDIGTRLSSPTGYEPARYGRLLWSGILDMYDPSTSNNRDIEQRLIDALAITGLEFGDYDLQRGTYSTFFKGGITGAALEEQRRKIESAFAAGLQEVSKDYSPVIAFDTTERLENASDPTQSVFPLSDDTASVTGWLLSQIVALRSGTVLLLGRHQERLYKVLSEKISQANTDSKRTNLPPIELHRVVVDPFDADEANLFFENRMDRFPRLGSLDDQLKHLLIETTQGNPLLLDLALQTFIESDSPASVREILSKPDALKSLARALIKGYFENIQSSERAVLLHILALCRNGVFAGLLQVLEPSQANYLTETLKKMEDLPFIKVRDITVDAPGRKPVKRRTYFFHDAMYAICDNVFLKPTDVRNQSGVIVKWYEEQITQFLPIDNRSPSIVRKWGVISPDLMAESLFYKMRANPVIGYNEYIQMADQLIRGAEVGLDMRLHDAFAQFITSATADESTLFEQNSGSPIDRANLRLEMPELPSLYKIDSATLWIKRYTIRGKRDQAENIGNFYVSQARKAYQDNPSLFRVTVADFLLWYGQALMYGSRVLDAVNIYEEALSMLAGATHAENEDTRSPLEELQSRRISLILGRLHNNLGYTYWMNFGQYSRAIVQFQLAIGYFQTSEIPEELANSSDNLGRVYALQGRRFQSIQLIENGLEIRKALGLSYREGLSEISLALVLARFGDINRALAVINGGFGRLGIANVKRGEGLSYLTRGMIYRSFAENWVDNGLSVDDGIRYVRMAEMDLRDSWSIFSGMVSEPIRLVQVLNELGCCHRAHYQLLDVHGGDDAVRDSALAQGRIRFLQAIDVAQKAGFLLEELDTLQDLAVMFYRAGDYAEARKNLDEVRQKVSMYYPKHVNLPGKRFLELDISERVDVCYKLLGQVELLEGTIMYAEGLNQAQTTNKSAKLPSELVLIAAAERFLLSVAYFHRHSGEDYARRFTYKRIYKRYKDCSPRLIREIVDVHVPEWIMRYDLPEDLVRSYFVDVFGLFTMPGKRI